MCVTFTIAFWLIIIDEKKFCGKGICLSVGLDFSDYEIVSIMDMMEELNGILLEIIHC